LYTNSVFSVGIRLVFLGIYRTDTGGKLGRYISVFFLAGTPIFLERGVTAPFLRGPAPVLRKKGFPTKPLRVPAKFFSAQNTDRNTDRPVPVYGINTNTGQAASIKTVYNSSVFRPNLFEQRERKDKNKEIDGLD
jgi:hypothetical protein